jgi:hypothetical protein
MMTFMKEQMLSPGDVLSFPIERIGRFGACQIVAADTSKQQVTVALLDWTGDHMPAPGDLVDAPRLVKTFMFWRASEAVRNVRLPAPSRYRAIGQLPVRGTTESDRLKLEGAKCSNSAAHVIVGCQSDVKAIIGTGRMF